MKKKVLFTATVDSHILNFHTPYLKYFKDNGYEVHVATNGTEKIPYCDVKHTVSFERSPLRLNNLKARKQLKKIIDTEQFEIIHTHTPMGSVVTRLAALSARKKFNTRVIYTAHGFHFYDGAPVHNWLFFYPVEKYLARYTDTLITINQEDYQRAKKNFKTRVEYVPGVGIDPEKIRVKMTAAQKLALRKSLGLKKDDYVLIYAAELSKRKRQLWLINALSDLLKKNPKLQLLLPGKDSMDGKLQAHVTKLGLEERVHFLGFRKDIPQLMAISNLSVSASVQEGLPVNILEAMFAGLPVIATDCRGNRDLSKTLAGYELIRCSDHKGFAEAVRQEQLYRYLNRAISNQPYVQKCSAFLNQHTQSCLVLALAAIYNLQAYTNKPIKLGILTSGFLPLPAVLGGAAETLCENFLLENEKSKKFNITIFSIYNPEAVKRASSYKCTDFVYVKTPAIITSIDLILYKYLKLLLPKKSNTSLRYILQRMWFTCSLAGHISNCTLEKILVENQISQLWCFRIFGNKHKYQNNIYLHLHNEVNKTFGVKKMLAQVHKIAVSRFVAEDLRAKLHDNSKLYSVVLNTVDQKLFNKKLTSTEIRRLKIKYNILPKDKVILFSGRLLPEKGLHLLVKSLRDVKYANYKLLIVGSTFFKTDVADSFTSEVIEQSKTIQDKIIFTGYLDYQDMPAVYKIADFAVLPSICNDAAPLTVIESLTAGLPVITTDVGGIPEYASANGSILLKNNEQLVNNMTRYIEILLNNRDELYSMRDISLEKTRKWSLSSYYIALSKTLTGDSYD